MKPFDLSLGEFRKAKEKQTAKPSNSLGNWREAKEKSGRPARLKEKSFKELRTNQTTQLAKAKENLGQFLRQTRKAKENSGKRIEAGSLLYKQTKRIEADSFYTRSVDQTVNV